MPETIAAISARLDASSPTRCTLEVDRPLYEGSAFFSDRKAAEGSPLAERLFRIPGLSAVRIARDKVVVTKDDPDRWRPITGQVAEAIREHIASGEPAVSPDYQEQRLSADDMKNRIQHVFDAQINPAIASHGGYVDLIEVKDDRVFVRLGGGCQGCGMANVTLRQGIEATLRQEVPQIEEILDVTDHASGSNPYYAPSRK